MPTYQLRHIQWDSRSHIIHRHKRVQCSNLKRISRLSPVETKIIVVAAFNRQSIAEIPTRLVSCSISIYLAIWYDHPPLHVSSVRVTVTSVIIRSRDIARRFISDRVRNYESVHYYSLCCIHSRTYIIFLLGPISVTPLIITGKGNYLFIAQPWLTNTNSSYTIVL